LTKDLPVNVIFINTLSFANDQVSSACVEQVLSN